MIDNPKWLGRDARVLKFG